MSGPTREAPSAEDKRLADEWWPCCEPSDLAEAIAAHRVASVAADVRSAMAFCNLTESGIASRLKAHELTGNSESHAADMARCLLRIIRGEST